MDRQRHSRLFKGNFWPWEADTSIGAVALLRTSKRLVLSRSASFLKFRGEDQFEPSISERIFAKAVPAKYNSYTNQFLVSDSTPKSNAQVSKQLKRRV